jgi:hypothetical protein
MVPPDKASGASGNYAMVRGFTSYFLTATLSLIVLD